MDDQTWTAAFEAQFLMGHCVPSAHLAHDRATITNWSWDADQVRQQLSVPLTALWDERVLELEMQGMASFSMHVAPVTWDEHGQEQEIPGWRDEPREKWGSVDILPQGVIRLAALYGRPYVKLEESRAVLAHWQLVQAECAAREQRLEMGWDEAQWAREWPERALMYKARGGHWEWPEEPDDADLA